MIGSGVNVSCLLGGLALVSAIALVLLATIDGIPFAMFGLGVVGLTYGALIAAYPAVISKLFGVLRGVKIYGRVFTAWGAAGLVGPWLAGALFDQGDHTGFAAAIMRDHYDPAYARSRKIDTRDVLATVTIASLDDAGLAQAASQIKARIDAR